MSTLCELVLSIPVLHFPIVTSGPSFSGHTFSSRALSSLDTWSATFRSCVFSPRAPVSVDSVSSFPSLLYRCLVAGRSSQQCRHAAAADHIKDALTLTSLSLSRLVRTCHTLVAAGSGFMQDRRTSVNIASIVMTAVIVWDKNGFCSVIFFCILFFFQLFIIIIIYSHKIKTCRTQRLHFKQHK